MWKLFENIGLRTRSKQHKRLGNAPVFSATFDVYSLTSTVDFSNQVQEQKN